MAQGAEISPFVRTAGRFRSDMVNVGCPRPAHNATGIDLEEKPAGFVPRPVIPSSAGARAPLIKLELVAEVVNPAPRSIRVGYDVRATRLGTGTTGAGRHLVTDPPFLSVLPLAIVVYARKASAFLENVGQPLRVVNVHPAP